VPVCGFEELDEQPQPDPLASGGPILKRGEKVSVLTISQLAIRYYMKFSDYE
jgi:hypothetical protein